MKHHALTQNQSGEKVNFTPLRPNHIQVYEALADFWARNGYAPLLRELADATQSTLRTVQRVIKDLEEKGFIERANTKAWRNLKPIKHPNIYKN